MKKKKKIKSYEIIWSSDLNVVMESEFKLMKDHVVSELLERGYTEEQIAKIDDVIEDYVIARFKSWYDYYGIEERREVVEEIISDSKVVEILEEEI